MAQILEAQGKEKEALEYWQKVLIVERNEEENHGLNWLPPELIMWRLQAYQRVNFVVN